MSFLYYPLNVYQFRDLFNEIRPDNFSYDGLGALYEYLSDLAYSIGEPIDVDVIGICCEYAEISKDDTRKDFMATLNCTEYIEYGGDAALRDAVEEVYVCTVVAETDNSFIIRE